MEHHMKAVTVRSEDESPERRFGDHVGWVSMRVRQEKRRFIVGKDLLSLHGYQPKGELGERHLAGCRWGKLTWLVPLDQYI